MTTLPGIKVTREFLRIEDLDNFVKFQQAENGLTWMWNRVSRRAWITTDEATAHDLDLEEGHEGEIYTVHEAAKRPLLIMLRGPGLRERSMIGVTAEQSRGL